MIQYSDDQDQSWRERFRCESYSAAEAEFNSRWIELIKSGFTKVRMRIVLAGPPPDMIIREVLRFESRD